MAESHAKCDKGLKFELFGAKEREVGQRYNQLTERDRIFLRIMLEKRYPKSKIAEVLGVHRATIYREIKRNSWTHWKDKRPNYTCFIAHARYLKRRQRATQLQRDKALRHYVHEKLKCGWSPWQIEGRLKREQGRCVISHETIYRYIYSDYGIRNRFYQKLRRKHFLRVKRHARQPRVPKALLIHSRPASINRRQVFGHWECDLMRFKQGIKANLITLRERKSRFMLAIKNGNKTASGTALGLIGSIKELKPTIQSITFDQGSEFQKYHWIKDSLQADIYFCDPASPQQKGAIENGNGVLRAELPRNYNVAMLKQKEINRLVDEINHRPLRCLDYQTPAECFLKLKAIHHENQLY